MYYNALYNTRCIRVWNAQLWIWKAGLKLRIPNVSHVISWTKQNMSAGVPANAAAPVHVVSEILCM